MPGLTLHFALANRVLERWRKTGETAPFDLYASADLNAFLHGAVGPDFGYMPGGHRLLSELAHGVRTGELTSRLIRSARTSIERAFAWGWLTHVLGDRLIHPWIGRGVGELTVGCSETFVAGATDMGSHLRVEIGVDCCYAARDAAARAVRLSPTFDAFSINFLSHAYAKTYGFVPRHASLLASHRHMGRRVSQSLGSIGLLSALMDRGTGPTERPALRWMLGAAHRAGLLSEISVAYLSPVRPSRWLMEAIDSVIPTHTELFMAMYGDGGTDIGDYDLDTGAPLTRTPSGARIARRGEVVPGMSSLRALLSAADDRLLLTLLLRRRPAADTAMRFVTRLGDVLVVGPLTLTLALGAIPHLREAGALALWNLTASHMLVQILKRRVCRGRPKLPVGLTFLIEPEDRFSFPSGHAAAGLSVVLPIAVALDGVVGTLVLVLGLAVGVSRCYLGVHYPGDVLVGWSLACVTFLAAPIVGGAVF